MMFEGRVILALQACTTVSGASGLTRMSWDEARGIMTRAVERGLLRRDAVEMPHLGVDEKSYGRGNTCVTILMDRTRGVVHATTAGRTKASLVGILKTLTPAQTSAVDAIAMDLHDPFQNAVREVFSQLGPAVVHDRFHIAKPMNEALNDICKEEAARLADEGTRTLVGSRQLWLFGTENIPAHRRTAFATLKNRDLDTATVWAQKECLRRLWSSTSVRDARWHVKRWAN